MGETFLITEIRGRQILDSRGNPTVEAEVEVKQFEVKEDTGETVLAGEQGEDWEKVIVGRAAVPSGASTGKFEAVELRDKEKAYLGQGVTKAVSHVNHQIRQDLLGKYVTGQSAIDELLCEIDGTLNKGGLGANATLAVSLACAKGGAKVKKMPLYRYLKMLGENLERTQKAVDKKEAVKECHEKNICINPEIEEKFILPVPMMNILNGGKHAKNTVDFQEFMIMPVGAQTFSEALRMGCEIYHTLKKILYAAGKSTAVGDEGGFAPDLKDVFEVFDYLTKAVEEAGYVCGKDIVFAMDAAASELYEKNSGMYFFPGETETLQRKEEKEYNFKVKDTTLEGVPDTKKLSVMRSTSEMISLYEELCNRYPLYSIEDGLHEEDWDGWRDLTKRLGNKVQLVGDDLFVTNSKRLQKGINEKCGNAILIKPNQIGTLTETMEAIKLAHENGYKAVVSHRSGETEDTTIADLAVAMCCGQIKTGAPCRTDRVAKYNQLLRIEEELKEEAVYPGMDAFRLRNKMKH